MRIYQVIARRVNCEGNSIGEEVLERFTKREYAESYKEDWEASWQTDENKWMPYKKTLRIEEINVYDHAIVVV